MHVGILGVRVGFQIGGLGRPVLPDDEGFVQGVEAVTAGAGAVVDGQGFLVAFRVGEVQRQGVCDPVRFFERFDDEGDEVVGFGGVAV